MESEVYRPGGLALTERAAEQIGLRPGQAVLDVGCGRGTTLAFLRARYGAAGWGIDLSEAAVEAAERAHPGITFLQGDAGTLPFPGEAFDAVFLECVLTLLEDPEGALGEAVRVLKTGGALVIGTLSTREEAGGLLNRGRLAEGPLRTALEALGLEVTLWAEEKRALTEFYMDLLFRFGSVESYRAEANRALGGAVLCCEVPKKGTGYLLLTARKGASGQEKNRDNG